MNTNINKVIAYILIVALSFGISPNLFPEIAKASTTSDNVNIVYPKAAYKKTVESPFTIKNSNEESIDPITGDLSLRHTDLSLKGKNGLDFNLTREYSLNQSNIYEGIQNNINTFSDTAFNLGSGWTWDLPYIEIRGGAVYVHRGGQTLGSTTGTDSNLYFILDDYLLKDVSLKADVTHIYSNGQTSSSFIFRENDGKLTYFDADGKLLGIVDRFNNEIKFTYQSVTDYFGVSRKMLYQVTDSVGRVITFNYSSALDIIVSVAGEGQSKTITYHKAQAKNIAGAFAASIVLGKYVLESVTDEIGNVVSYQYDVKAGNFNFDTTGSTNYDNWYATLSLIAYPTGATTYYGVESIRKRLGTDGSMASFRINDRRDQTKDNLTKARKHYTYNTTVKFNTIPNDTPRAIAFDGYPSFLFATNDKNVDSDPNLTLVLNTVVTDTQNNNTITYSFNPRGMVYKIADEGTDHKVEVSRNYDVTKQLAKTVTVTTNKSTFQTMRNVENINYDIYKLLQNYSDPQSTRDGNDNPTDNMHTIFYNYHTDYHYILQKIYHVNDSSTVTEQYVPSTTDGGKTISSRTLTQGTLKAKSDYLYDSYGNVTQETQYADPTNVSTATTIKYSYTDAVRGGLFNGAYVTRKWNDNVKDKDGNLVAARSGNPAGTVDETYEYSYFGNLAKKNDGAGNATSYLYDAKDRPTRVTKPDLTYQTTTYRTDAAENSVIVKDENANSSAFSASGKQSKYLFDDIGNLKYEQLWSAGAFQNIFEFQYNNDNQLLLEINSVNGANINYSYYSNGTINSLLTKNNQNQVLAGDSYTYQFAANSGQNTIVTKTHQGDAASPSTIEVMTFDRLGQLVKVEQPHNGQTYQTTYTYDLMGNKIAVKSARANNESWIETYTQQYEYDYANRLTKTITVNGDYATIAYDSLGRKVKETDFEGNMANVNFTNEYVYDQMNRLLRKGTALEDNGIDIPTGHTLTQNSNVFYTYDLNGNVVNQSMNNGVISDTTTVRSLQYAYNNRNQLVQTKEIGTSSLYSQYYYDATGNLLRKYTGLSSPLTITGLDQVTATGDSSYSTEQYAYNALGKPTQVTDSLGQSSAMTYDLTGNLMTATDRNGNQSVMSYDGLNRLLTRTVTSPSTGANVQQTNVYSISGNLKSMTSGQSSSAFTYDDLGRLTIDVTDGVQKDYDYDANGNRKLFKVTANGTTSINETYSYDKLNRLSQVLSNGSVEATYQYDKNGNTTNVAYANGTTTALSYNRGSMVKSVLNKKASTTLSQFGYDYYADGNLYHQTDATGSTSYSYDGGGRLKQTTRPTNDTTIFSYDDYGNRSEQIDRNSSSQIVKDTVYQYDKNNRLQFENKTEGTKKTTTSYMFDPNGNTKAKLAAVQEPTQSTWQSLFGLASDEFTSNDLTTYNYDAINELTGVGAAGHTYSYAYNAAGLRTQKVVDGTVTKDVWDGQQLVMETNASNAVLSTYIRGNGLINSTDASNTKQYYLFNGHGDVTSLTDVNGNEIKSYKYDEFGNELNLNPLDTNPFRYAGEYFEKETATYYLRARSYDPSIGRFINEDTYEGDIKNPLSLNLYTYVENNPLKYSDPSGHCLEDACLIEGAVAGVIWAYRAYRAYKTAKLIIDVAESLGDSSSTDSIQSSEIYSNESSLKLLDNPNVPQYVKDSIIKSQKEVASNVPDGAIKPGTKEWKEAVKKIKEGKGKGINFKVKSKEDADKLLNEARSDLKQKETYTDEKYKDGYENHPAEPDVGNDLPHIKWKDWTNGKANGGEGHIYFPE